MGLREDFDPVFADDFKSKSGALERLGDNTARMTDLQDMLYAQDMYSILMVFQAMGATGTDGAIRHVLSSVNQQDCHVTSFKAPSAEKLDRDLLW